MMSPSGSADPYAFIESRGYGIESPECKHNVKQIAVVGDADLGHEVFAFTIHRESNDDRCENFDRQRLEIKTWNQSPANMTGANGETQTYAWKFKLDAGFKPSPSFTHIHQIKAQGGDDDDAPIITLTPRAGSPEKMQLMHIPSGGGGGVVAEVLLAPFKGTWVEVEEQVKYRDKGSIQIVIRKAKDKTPLLTFTDADLDMWRAGAELNRPKYGIYRSLNDKSALRDETVLFADFCLAEAAQSCQGSSAGIPGLLPYPGRAPETGGLPQGFYRWMAVIGGLRQTGRTAPWPGYLRAPCCCRNGPDSSSDPQPSLRGCTPALDAVQGNPSPMGFQNFPA